MSIGIHTNSHLFTPITSVFLNWRACTLEVCVERLYVTSMTYEYEVPYVDFVTAFGEDDGADTFFDAQIERLDMKTPASQNKKDQQTNDIQIERLAIKRTPVSQNKKHREQNGRSILKEIPSNVQNIESSQVSIKILQYQSPERDESANDESKYRCENSKEGTLKPISQVKPVSALKRKMHIQTIEEVDGEFCVKNNEIKDTGVPRTIPSHPTKLHFQRLSFEERQKLPMKKREEQIKKVLEEEKRKREFRANPVPNYLKLTKRKSSTYRTARNLLENNTKITFRARPAYVIRKQPFLPKKSERSALKPKNVVLHSEKRAKAREEFDVKLRQHYKEIEEEVETKKKLQQQKEMEEIAKLRKKLVHKAQPAPAYKTTHVPAKTSTGSKGFKSCDELKK